MDHRGLVFILGLAASSLSLAACQKLKEDNDIEFDARQYYARFKAENCGKLPDQFPVNPVRDALDRTERNGGDLLAVTYGDTGIHLWGFNEVGQPKIGQPEIQKLIQRYGYFDVRLTDGCPGQIQEISPFLATYNHTVLKQVKERPQD